MTLPIERTRAVINTEKFLLELCQPSQTPKVPKAIRERARSLLRHYPRTHDFHVVEREWNSSYECPFKTKDEFFGYIKE